jgi:two-component system chemotaxis response regulator CheY
MAFTPVMETPPKPGRQEAGASSGTARTAGLSPDNPVAAIPSALTKSGMAGAVRHLLVVDDEQPVRSLVKMMGQHLGYVVLEAVNGAEAIAQLQKKPGGIDVVLTDVNMPVMDGIALVRALRKLPAPPAIAVMSGRFDPMIRTTLLAEGVTVLMGKPFSTDELGLTLSQLSPAAR